MLMNSRDHYARCSPRSKPTNQLARRHTTFTTTQALHPAGPLENLLCGKHPSLHCTNMAQPCDALVRVAICSAICHHFPHIGRSKSPHAISLGPFLTCSSGSQAPVVPRILSPVKLKHWEFLRWSTPHDLDALHVCWG